MIDIFISHSKKDNPQVQKLVRTLEALGWRVWWDHSIPAGKAFDKVIERAIERARCILVLWSRESVGSDWVRAEAWEGLKREILIPMFLEDVEPPMVFRLLQTGQLSGWKGGNSDPGFRWLVKELERLLGPCPNVERGRFRKT